MSILATGVGRWYPYSIIITCKSTPLTQLSTYMYTMYLLGGGCTYNIVY